MPRKLRSGPPFEDNTLRKILIGLAVLVVLLIAAVLIVPSFLDWNQYKQQITAAAREATGRSVAVDGDISLRLLPAPALSVGEVRIGNIAGGSEADMVRLRALDVQVAFVPLLSGRIEVASVRLVAPVALLEVLADGRVNWQFGGAGAGVAATTTAPAAEEAGATPLELTLERFEIVDGEVVYRDARSGTEERISAVNLSGSAGSLQGPFAVAGGLVARELPLSIDLSIGQLAEGRAVPVALSAELSPQLNLEMKGRVENLLTAPQLAGLLRVQSPNLVAAGARAGVALPALLAQPVELDSRLAASAKEVALNDLNLSLGGTNANGAINLGLENGLTFDAALTVGRLDLDAMLQARAEAEETGTVSAGDDDGVEAAAPSAAAGLRIPQNLSGNLSLNVDGVAYRGSVVRQAQLSASMLDGTLELTRASALLPGGSDVSLTGRAVNADGAARFDGRVEFASDSLRTLLTWLDVDVSSVPTDRLTSFTMTTGVTATPTLIQLTDANLRLDTVSATAAAAYRLQRRPSFGISLSVDRLNLDAYVPAAAAPAPAQAGGDATRTGAAAGDATAADLAVLDAFDANLLLNVAQLITGGVDLNGISVDASLVGGALTVKQLQVTDLAGGSLAVSGSARGFAAEPELDSKLQYLAPDLSGLMRLAGIAPGAPGESLDDLRLTTTLRGTAKTLALRAQLSLAGGTGEINGSVGDLLGAPTLALDYKAQHPSLTALAAALDLGLAPTEAADKSVKLSGAVNGNLDALETSLALEAAAAKLTLSGRLAELAQTARLDLSMALAGDDLSRTLEGLGVDYRPAAEPGAFALAMQLAGDTAALAVNDLRGQLGSVELSGKGKAQFSGTRPLYSAELNAGDVNLDLLLPRADNGAGGVSIGGAGNAAGPGERWSRAPIDLSVLQGFDAELKLAAASLTFQDYPFIQPRLSLNLSDGTAKIEELTGQLFQGSVRLEAEVASRPVPAVAMTVKLTDADVNTALRTALGLDNLSGTLSFDGDFRARGASERGLVRSLAGTANFTASDGVIRGFDMQSFSDRLGELNQSADYVDLLARSFSGGETAMSAARGSWQVENGVARTEDTRADLDAAEGTMTGTIDLANWRMDLRAVLRLTEHRNAPDLGVHMVGPLDTPRYDLKTRELEQWLAARLGTELLRKGLGDEKLRDVEKVLDLITRPGTARDTPPAAGQTPSDDGADAPAQPRPEEALEGLIRGLLKR